MAEQIENGFQETQLGRVPSDWRWAQLGQVVDFTRKPSEIDLSKYDAVPFIPMELVPDNGGPILHYELRRGSSIKSGIYCEPGDILLAKITPSFENGKQGIVPELSPPFAYATTEVFPLRARPQFLDQTFLLHYLRVQRFRTEVAAKMEGSTGRQRVPKAVIERYPIPLPPLSEQRRIAHVLSTLQRAIQAQDAVIVAARELKHSLIHRLFTYGPYAEPLPTKETDFGEVPLSWPEVGLEHCAKVQTGVAKGRKLDGADTVELPYLRVANVQDGYLDLDEIKTLTILRSELHRFRLQDRDVLLTEGGDFDKLGRGFIWRNQLDPCIHQNHIFAVRTDRSVLLPEFFSYLVQSVYGKGYFLKVAHRTTNLASINSTKLKALPVLLASMDEQKAVVNMLEQVDFKVAMEERRGAALEALFKSMLHQLMTGQVRVPSADFGSRRL